MLTRQQTQRLAQRHAIGLHAQETDYGSRSLQSLAAGQSGRNGVRGADSDKTGPLDLVWSKEAWRAAVARVETEWERDLRPLLPQFVDFAVAKELVAAALPWPKE